MTTEFTDDQFESNYPEGAEYHWWFLARNRIIAEVVNTFSGRASSILEVGCGRGIVVKSLRDAGLDCSGVELAKPRPIIGAEKHIHVGRAAAALSSAERKRYDTLHLLDVIEHLPEPPTFLQHLVDAFPNLARIIVTVPARQELWSNYDEFYGHYRRYTPGMLEGLASELRWSVRRMSYFFHSVYFPAWIVTKLKKDRQTHLKPPRGVGRLTHRLISYAMILDYYLLPGRLAGTSIIACFDLGRGTHHSDRLSAV